ncbi:SLC13 family permease [Halobacillus amylolyticus]|uniref:Sodium-dependent dicarboxylate transporter SdcS n=1 Tax=Halobacillus amylolyticus TaxID=2932259 RepID=A0ABY4HGB4_9BACI|nr:DASS family sodium-coupled anion symporter [Halobacillus amylolyticus]UOR13697.1 DASS family sodium-coupled anion symporter [Halobacillus amylolyticus]
MNADKHKKQTVKWMVIFLALLLILVADVVPRENVASDKEWTTLAILLFAITLWFTEVIPAAVTSMVVIVLYPLLDVITFEEAAQGLGNEIIWLVLSMLIMAAAVKKTNLDKRIAFFILSLSYGRIRLILLNFIILAFLLTFIIPNAIGRLSVLLPIGISFIKAFENELEVNFSKSIILIITFVPYLSTISILTGAGGSIYAASLFESMLNYEWSYLHWMIVMTPISLLILLFFWLLLLWLFPVKLEKLKGINYYLEEEKSRLGDVTASEKKLGVLYSLLIILWVTKEIHHIPISMSAVLICIMLFVPGFNIIKWEEAKNGVNWGVPLLFAAGFTIAFALQTSGVVVSITTLVEEHLKNIPNLVLPLILMLIFVAIRIVFTNYTAMVASLLPVALTFANGSPLNPVWLGMICVVASSTSYLFPSQSIGNMMTYSLGYYNGRDMFVVGSVLTSTIIIITLLLALFYWPLVGITMY